MLCLNLETSRADGIVFAAQNAEAAVRAEFGNIVGGQLLGTHLWGMDDETAIAREGNLDAGKRGIPVGGIRTIKATQGDMAEGFCHSVGAPDIMGKVAQLTCKVIVDGPSSDNQMPDLPQAFSLFWHLQRVVNL